MEKLTSTQDALKLNFNRANYQAKLWLGACQHAIVVKVGLPEMSQGWHVTDLRLEAVWSTLLAVPSTCLELVACGCKTKCKSATCKCSSARGEDEFKIGIKDLFKNTIEEYENINDKGLIWDLCNIRFK